MTLQICKKSNDLTDVYLQVMFSEWVLLQPTSDVKKQNTPQRLPLLKISIDRYKLESSAYL